MPITSKPIIITCTAACDAPCSTQSTLRNALLPISREQWLFQLLAKSVPFRSERGSRTRTTHRSRPLTPAVLLRLNLALLRSDGPDQDAENCFCYDVRNRVSDLLAGRRRDAGDSEHLDDVHEGIRQPGDDRKPAGVSRERRDRSPMCGGQLLRSFTQPNGELRHNIQEWNHGKEPPHPPAARTVLDLARIAKSHHDRRRDTQRPALAHRFFGWQSHNQDQLDEEERDRENPVDIPIGIVEGSTSEGNRVVALLRVELHIEGIIPGVENAEVVVCRDGGHQTSDGERRAVLLVHIVDLEPEEDRRTSHPRDTE